jgi:hypothetical protein
MIIFSLLTRGTRQRHRPMNFTLPRSARGLPLLFISLLVPAPARAQQAQPTNTAGEMVRKQHAAVRAAPRAPRVDGRLDDEAWAAAPVLSDLVQKEPVEGERATERTEVRFVYDDQALYVGARMYSKDPGAIQAPVAAATTCGQAET